MGKVCVALYNNAILMDRQTKKPTIQSVEIDPEVSLALPKHDAKPTSKNPAMMSKIQFILWFDY